MIFRQQRDADLGMDEVLQLLELVLRLLPRRRDHDAEARHDLEMVGVAAVARHAVLHVAIDIRARPSIVWCAQNTTSAVSAASCRPSSDAPACTTTGWPCGERETVSGPLHLEEFARVVEHVPPVGIVEAAVLLVEHEGIVVPAIPQAAHHVDELARAPVALVLRQVLLAAEILRFGVVGRRHQIPARAAAADQIERREAARDVIGLVVGRRRRADEADVLRHRRERREQRHRLDPRDVGRARQGFAIVALAGQRVGRKHQIEQPALGGLRHLDIFREIQPAVRPGILVPPAGDVMRRRPQEHAELDLSRPRHSVCPHSAHLQFARRLCPFACLGKLTAMRKNAA